MEYENLIHALNELTATIAGVDISNCSDIAADKISDGLFAVAHAIDDITVELKHRNQAHKSGL